MHKGMKCLVLKVIVLCGWAMALQGETITVNPVDDTILNGTSTSGTNTYSLYNYGNTASLMFRENGGTKILLLRFDLSPYAEKIATRGFVVTNATLRLYYSSTGNKPGNTATPRVTALRPGRATWQEGTGNGTVTNDGPTWGYYLYDTKAWYASGAASYDNDYMGPWGTLGSGSVPMDGPAGWYEIVLNPTFGGNTLELLFRSWAGLSDGAYGASDPVNPGLKVLAGQGLINQYVDSSEGTHPPELVIEYTVPALGTIITLQ